MSAVVLRCGFKHSLRCLCAHLSENGFHICIRQYVNAAQVQTIPEDSGVAAGPSSSQSLHGDQRLTEPKTTVTFHHERAQGQSRPTFQHLLKQTKVEQHLAAIKQTENTSLTLSDLEYYRPRIQTSLDSEQYEEDYNALLETLLRSFTRTQLRTFGQLCNLDPRLTRTKRRKEQYAVALIEHHWKWPSLFEARRRQQSWIRITESFSMDPRLSFLIMGKDGSDLLALSAQYNVHMTLSSNPLSLNVTGPKGSLDQLSRYIKALKRGIHETTVKLPFGGLVPVDLLQRISRLAGAFTENFSSPGTIRISGKDYESVNLGRRLAIRTSCGGVENEERTVLAYIPAAVTDVTSLPLSIFPSIYASFPFLSPGSLPWMVKPEGTFRLRKVGEWLGLGNSEDVSKTGGLVGGRGRILTIAGNVSGLQDNLLSKLGPKTMDGAQRLLTASLGHALIPSSSDSRQGLIPPLKGSWPFPEVLDWLKSNQVKILFTPNLPTSMLGPTPLKQRVIHRLTYYRLPNLLQQSTVEDHLRPPKFIKLEIPLTFPEVDSSSDIVYAPRSDGSVTHSQAGVHVNEVEEITIPEGRLIKASPRSAELDLSYDCWLVNDSTMDLLMPDRPMDIQFSVSDISPLPIERWPEELRQYLGDLRTFLQNAGQNVIQPESPLMLEFGGHNYSLHSNTSVRQGRDSVLASSGDREVMRINTEHILDLESNQKSSICQVVCQDTDSMEAWTMFLSKCDELTTVKQKRKPLELNLGLNRLDIE